MALAANDVYRVRSNLGLSQLQFAQLLGVHPITVSKWERGVTGPTPYQEAFIKSFRRAAQDKTAREAVGTMLVGAGIVAAILLLLNAAERKGG